RREQAAAERLLRLAAPALRQRCGHLRGPEEGLVKQGGGAGGGRGAGRGEAPPEGSGGRREQRGARDAEKGALRSLRRAPFLRCSSPLFLNRAVRFTVNQYRR